MLIVRPRVATRRHASPHLGASGPFLASASLVAMKARRTSSDHWPVVPPSIGLSREALCFFLGLAFSESVKERWRLPPGRFRKSAMGVA